MASINAIQGKKKQNNQNATGVITQQLQSIYASAKIQTFSHVSLFFSRSAWGKAIQYISYQLSIYYTGNISPVIISSVSNSVQSKKILSAYYSLTSVTLFQGDSIPLIVLNEKMLPLSLFWSIKVRITAEVLVHMHLGGM